MWPCPLSFHTVEVGFHNFSPYIIAFFKNIIYICNVFPHVENLLGNQLWRDTYILKAFSGRFGFDALRISQIRTDSQKQSNGNAP